jgi:hypothetical protein
MVVISFSILPYYYQEAVRSWSGTSWLSTATAELCSKESSQGEGRGSVFLWNPGRRIGMGLLIYIHVKWNLLDGIMSSIFYGLF